MKNKYPSLYEGLAQIPKDYLKNNLLPMLEDEKSQLVFSGTVAQIIDNVQYIWPMVAALPGAIWKKQLKQNHQTKRNKFHPLSQVIWLTQAWFQENIKEFDTAPSNYIIELKEAQRKDTLQLVKDIINDER